MSDKMLFQNILPGQLEKHFDTSIHNLWANENIPVFVNFINKEKFYQEVESNDALKEHITKCITNLEHGTTLQKSADKLVLFKSALMHGCHFARGISRPGGMLLIGANGTGRKSICQLMTSILGYKVFEIQASENYGVEQFHKDIKKLLHMTGVKKAEVVFFLSDMHLTNESFVLCINDILTSSGILNLFEQEELVSIYSDLASSLEENVPPEQMCDIFLHNIKSKLHVVLSLSSSGPKFRELVLKYPGVINYSTIDWYETWTTDALQSIAEKYLANVDVGEPLEKRHLAVSQVFSSIHEKAVVYSQKMRIELNRNVSITSTNYLDLVQSFDSLLTRKSLELTYAINRLESGLEKIEETQQKVNIMAEELKIAQVEVSNFQKECDEYLVIISQQREEADLKQEVVAAQRVEIEAEEVKCKALADAAEQDLNAALPLLEEAKKALESLNSRDIGEIKSYPKPPVLVETVMEAVMILRESDPSWAEAKRQLGNPFFLTELFNFEKDNISDSTLHKIGKYVSKPDFKPHIVGKVSIAAKSLCMWVRAMHSYGRLFRVVLPKRLRLYAAQEELRKQQEHLAEALRKLKELEDKINQLKQEYEAKLRRKEELHEQEQLLALKLRRAEDLVSGLNSEKQRWEVKVAHLKEKIIFVVGDCIIASSFISYLGPFVSNFREEMLQFWKKKLCSLRISFTEKFVLCDYLVSDSIVTEWNVNGLPNDNYSIDNAVIISESTHWPLIIDPHEQAVKWIKKVEKNKGLKVIDPHDASYLKMLQLAITDGTPVLIQNIQSKVDSALYPVFKKSLFQKSKSQTISFGGADIICSSNFKLYLASKLKNPEFAPEVWNRVCVINFATKEKGLEDQFLSIVVRKERPDLEDQKKNLVTSITLGKNKLQEIENTVLRHLNEAQGSLLDNEELVRALNASRMTSRETESQLSESQGTEAVIDTARETYRPCARRAAVLFFVLSDVSSIDPMYLFSLDTYINLFLNSIKKSSKDADIQRRITKLNDYHTYAVYKFACRAMFEIHKLLLSFHMCAKILESANELNREEYDFFLRGGIITDRSNQPPNPCPAWLPSICWDNITLMEQLPRFLDLASLFDENSKLWHEWYVNTEPEKLFLPGKWRNICNEFQKILFIRSLRPDRITTCIMNYIANNLGKKYLEPPGLDVESSYQDSLPQTPLLFILSSGVDPVEYVSSVANINDMSDRYFALSLGQGQGDNATALIMEAQVKGFWVYIANCHLLISYMPVLERIISNQLQSKELHKDFRLWLSSMSTPHFPVSVLQNSIKITTETPKGLKANMKKLYSLVNRGLYESCVNQTKYFKLLFSLSFLHSVLVERNKFQDLGWNVPYNFNESDFKMSEEILRIFLDKYEDTPWEALKHLIVDINYGGHITDLKDNCLLDVYFDEFMCDEALQVPKFELSTLPTYFIPEDGPLISYNEYIESLPQEERPEVFGQNTNAEISFRIKEATVMLENLLKAQPVKMSVSKESQEENVLVIINNVLQNIPHKIEEQGARQLLMQDPSPYHHVLLQDTTRYNALIKLVRTSLKQLDNSIKGTEIMTPATEDLFTTIQKLLVPSEWLKTYPSVKPLGSWVNDLKLRIQQINNWIEMGEPPVKIWLSGFTNPISILNATLQEAARQGDVLIQDLKWEFAVSALEEAHITDPPQEGIFVRGLFLEGAGWDRRQCTLTEPDPLQLFVAMPVIHFKPVHEVNTKGLYQCPCYYIPKRTYKGASTFVMNVNLKSKTTSKYWVKRGTALILNLT